MQKIGFIGLGLIGAPMCLNLVKGKYSVSVWNRTKSKVEKLVDAGAISLSSPKEIAENSEVIITCVSDSKDVKDVVLGSDGVIEGIDEGKIVIDMSTISPSVTREIAEQINSKKANMLDAPVSGGVNGAEAGVLSIMVGGDKSVLDSVSPILNELGSKITYCGSNGMGQVTKLSNQIIGMGNLAAMCEAIVFASKAGADPEALINAWSAGAAGSWMVDNLGEKVFKREFEPGFMVKLAQKDLNLVLDAASQMDVALFTTPIISQIFRATQQSGFSDEGIHAYVKVLENIAGLNVKSK